MTAISLAGAGFIGVVACSNGMVDLLRFANDTAALTVPRNVSTTAAQRVAAKQPPK